MKENKIARYLRDQFGPYGVFKEGVLVDGTRSFTSVGAKRARLQEAKKIREDDSHPRVETGQVLACQFLGSTITKSLFKE